VVLRDAYRRYRGPLVALLFVALVLPTLAVQHVRAATVVANNFTDRANGACATTGVGDCTLRETVIYADYNPGTTIQLLAGTYNLTTGVLC